MHEVVIKGIIKEFTMRVNFNVQASSSRSKKAAFFYATAFLLLPASRQVKYEIEFTIKLMYVYVLNAARMLPPPVSYTSVLFHY